MPRRIGVSGGVGMASDYSDAALDFAFPDSVSMDELAGLTDEARELAMERFRLLQAHLENDEPLTGVARAGGDGKSRIGAGLQFCLTITTA